MWNTHLLLNYFQNFFFFWCGSLDLKAFLIKKSNFCRGSISIRFSRVIHLCSAARHHRNCHNLMICLVFAAARCLQIITCMICIRTRHENQNSRWFCANVCLIVLMAKLHRRAKFFVCCKPLENWDNICVNMVGHQGDFILCIIKFIDDFKAAP